MAEPRVFRERVNGIELQVYEWAGSGPPILLAHATGFHARCWDGVVRHLPGRYVIAWDMRGHGLSDKPEPPYPWSNFAADATDLVRRLGVRRAIGVGHSKGGHAITMAAAALPGAFRSLLLVDPVIGPRERYGKPMFEGEHFAARRRNEWTSPEEMYERFKDRAPFGGWDQEVLRDYCRYGLVPRTNGGGYVLACPPAIEAATYAGSMGSDPYPAIAAIDVPVRVLRARQRTAEMGLDMSGSPTDPGLAASFRNAEDVYLPQYTHFLPMEGPAFVAAQILEMVEATP